MTNVMRGAAAPSVATFLDDRPSFDSLDEALSQLASRVDAWAATTPHERARLLERVVADTYAVSNEWQAAACAAKGYSVNSPEGGEELFSGVGTFIRMAQAFKATMDEIANEGRPHLPGPVHSRPGNRIAIQVLPKTSFDKILYKGISAEVWMQPNVSHAETLAFSAAAYRHPQQHAGVSLVLGAGNVASLGPRDVLTKLFAEGKVVLLKANPVNEYLVPYWEWAMAALIKEGVLRIVTGGAETGAYLTQHPIVTDVHVTGSDKTHDAIVFGVGDEGRQRKAENSPLLTKPVSCELGNVSPILIVPGTWSKKEISYQAAHVATMLTNNAGFNCLTPRVLVTYAGWAQREEFLMALYETLASLPTRRAYYPGARERHASFLREHPEARLIGSAEGDALPWTVIEGVDATKTNDIVFNVEAFCSLMAETPLEAASVEEFIAKAVDFCNDVIWGTLSMTILADPRTLSDRRTGPLIELAVADLRYGSVGVNLWHAMSFAFSSTVWGACPGHTMTDIQSGTGFVGNSYLLAHAQKSVVRGPFFSSPRPPWFATNRRGHDVMRKFLAYEARPSLRRLVPLVMSSLRS
jgi:acyl-CoA reductase-like NAD-dependent aldehyde dehydrogenase